MNIEYETSLEGRADRIEELLIDICNQLRRINDKLSEPELSDLPATQNCGKTVFPQKGE